MQSAELENEHGKLIWSFDITDPKSPNVIEVQVDAKSGRIGVEEVRNSCRTGKGGEGRQAIETVTTSLARIVAARVKAIVASTIVASIASIA